MSAGVALPDWPVGRGNLKRQKSRVVVVECAANAVGDGPSMRLRCSQGEGTGAATRRNEMARAPRDAAADRAAFVREIVSDPKAVPDVMLLYGYLGASSEEDHERLYLSPDLTNYVEIPTSAILHQMAAPKEQDPHGGVTLWVKKDAALVYRMAPAADAVAHYFAGAIQAGAQAAAAAPIPT